MEVLQRLSLVEDDPRGVELTLAALADHKLAKGVAVARDRVQALDYLYRRGAFEKRPTGNPVVIRLDLRMPRTDGVSLLQQIKADEKLRLIPDAILTPSCDSQDSEACYQLGVNAYLVKQVRLLDCVDRVEQTGVFWLLIHQPAPPHPVPGDGE